MPANYNVLFMKDIRYGNCGSIFVDYIHTFVLVRKSQQGRSSKGLADVRLLFATQEVTRWILTVLNGAVSVELMCLMLVTMCLAIQRRLFDI